MKITARRKNRSEKGIRALFLGSNPHSKGEHFSRSNEERDDIIKAVVKTKEGTKIATIARIKEISMY